MHLLRSGGGVRSPLFLLSAGRVKHLAASLLPRSAHICLGIDSMGGKSGQHVLAVQSSQEGPKSGSFREPSTRPILPYGPLIIPRAVVSRRAGQSRLPSILAPLTASRCTP